METNHNCGLIVQITQKVAFVEGVGLGALILKVLTLYLHSL
jgi:hypothetical protein